MENSSIIENRLRKNHKKLAKWLAKEQIAAYRIYDKDIPEYPYIVDVYNNFALVFEKGKKLDDSEQNLRSKHMNELFSAITEVLGIKDADIILKKREIQKGVQQYEQIDKSENLIQVYEHSAKLHINLYDYLDTGLFLDHRPLRKIIKTTAKDKKVLNLFSYTGSISVMAALGGGHVTTVDMSKTYVNWSMDNFRLNSITIRDHVFVMKNAFDFLKENQHKYDIIILDPPSFSNSKRMDGTFDVQRDHPGLIDLCMNRLSADGVLYFSNNNRKFKMDSKTSGQYFVKDITKKTIPQDFRDLKIHQCYEIRAKK